uniref:C2H2-type domain-containing protein n=1 Tax=Zonotrichia albicollis TaxID=44394 RepID=A0A8D2N9A4_ZONAL
MGRGRKRRGTFLTFLSFPLPLFSISLSQKEESFPEDLKQEELPQVHEAQSPERGAACDVSPHELLTHLQIHTREKVFVCAECGKSFGRKANLVVHQRVHTGERPFKCKECEKTFSRASSLLAHHKTHLKKKIFSCTMCRKNFSGNAALLQHQRVHTEEKPCRHSEHGNSFSVSSNFIRYQHLRDRPSEHTAGK